MPSDLAATTASDLFANHGDKALHVARQRAEELAAGSREHDFALRVLSHVENLLGTGNINHDRRG